MDCKICNNKTRLFDKAIVLNKYNVNYYQCEVCGCIQTEEPYWLNEAYSDAITSIDIGLISRNIDNAEFLNKYIPFIFPKAKTFLDYGGGYGILTRRMRDLGYDFEWYDEYCENIFSKGHECKKAHYDVLTSFEMFEHLLNPVETCEKMCSLADTIIFSTTLLPSKPPKINDWWYYCKEHGQHIVLYTQKGLEFLAERFGKKYFYLKTNKGEFHIFSNKDVKINKCYLLLKRVIGFIKKPVKKTSLLASDFESLTGLKI